LLDIQITSGFRPLDQEASRYLLDTNVWSALATSPEAVAGFPHWLDQTGSIAGLAIFSVFELSRASRLHDEVDGLLTSAASRVFIPLLYDELASLEMSNYPDDVELLWNPLSSFEEAHGVRFLSAIARDSRFVDKRQEYLEFGHSRFMNLEALKENFPLDEYGTFSPDDAELFAWANTLDFLLRYFPRFLLPFKGNLQAFDTKKLKSVHVRSLFLYFKYYVHGQSPTESDFMDFAHVSYLPYVDTYVTERNVLNVLTHMRSTGHEPKRCQVVHIQPFLHEVENAAPKSISP
jgi:hypothetical protein